MFSVNTNTSTNVQSKKSCKRNNGNRGPRNHKNRFVTTLSSERQVGKVIADIENLNDSNHLQNWSASARKKLAPHIIMVIEVQHEGKLVDILMPKLALLAASPVFRSHMKENPGDVDVKFRSRKVSLGAMKTIGKWLRKICSERDYTALPFSGNIRDNMQLCMTAHTLGMAQYVQEIEERYIRELQSRVPEPDEITAIIEHTTSADDPVVVALAYRLSSLCKYHQVEWEMEIKYANLLADDKLSRLLDAVKVGLVEGKRA